MPTLTHKAGKHFGSKSIGSIHCVSVLIVWLCNSMQKKITRQNKFAGLLNQTSFTHSIERRKDTLNKVV